MRSEQMHFILAGALAFVITAVAMATSVSALPLMVKVIVIFAIAACAIYVAFLLSPLTQAQNDDERGAVSVKLPAGYGRALLDRVPVALFVISDRGRFVYVNPAAENLNPRIKLNNHFATAIRAPEFVEKINAVLEHGGERAVEFNAAGTDRVFGALIASLDDPAHFGDEAGVIVRLDELTQIKRDARARSDFIANASHELRTPLASLIGYIETLQGHAKGDAQAQERFLGIMSNQANRMQRLVDDLMSLSRIELEEGIAPEGAVDIANLFVESSAALSPVAEKAGVKMSVPSPDGLHHVLGDRDQLLQVAVNLLENAIKYGGAGGNVVVAYRPLGDGVEVSVSDDGPGIERHHLVRLTERFYRVNTAATSKVSGTGLGLAIVKHIINRHRGKFSISSEVGVGSEFVIWLPNAAVQDPKPDLEKGKDAA